MAGEERNTCPGNYQPVPGRATKLAEMGTNMSAQMAEGPQLCGETGSSSGSAGPAAGPAQGHSGPGEGHQTPWGWQEPGQEGYWKWCTPNPDRYYFRGRGSQERREKKRQLEREGKPVPEHLKPQAHVLNKAAKQQMFLLHQRAREMASAQSQEELDEITEKFIKLQQDEAKKLESLRKAKDAANASQDKADGDGDDTVPARKAYVGKHRSQSVPAKGTPPEAKESGTLAADDGADDCSEEEEADDTVPDWGDDTSKEGKKKKKKSKSRSRSRAKKEAPPEKKDPDDPQGPKGPNPPPAAAATASA